MISLNTARSLDLAIGKAVEELNLCIRATVDAGMSVEVSVHETQTVGATRVLPVIEASAKVSPYDIEEFGNQHIA
jgi:hypothetical protein